MLAIQHLTKQFGAKPALRNIHLTFRPGVTGLLGPNGAGKSTLMRILATIDQPTDGGVFYHGQNIAKKPNVFRQILGYLPQDFGVYPNLSATEFLSYMAAMKGLRPKDAKRRIRELLEILNLTHTGKKALGGFSGGMKQRVGIAQALLNNPKVLIVDEPTVGLDPQERIEFRNLLVTLASDRIIILSTHIVSDIESIAPQIVVMKAGHVLADTTPEQLIQEAEGKIWQAIVSISQLPEMQQQFLVSNAIQRADGIHLRLIADRKPILGANPIEPTLEDAYLLKTGEKRGGV
ncbi:ABC transporter ATP-binding protein [Paenibacillus oryzae]|uniref:ABC transporter ATP-binding protein n=1 Tax=Paenibacillus oryzae TaxID=1844972 RepID=A0A1A5YMG5_9BACL|nr:ABC transporter ATP-binding protein [Paenibacillus oryzae]OBR66733.1 ABC transporter ATP-binding protein [Paenibacillus oryzae]